MKSFIKFIVTLIVVLLIGYVTYNLIVNSSEMNDDILSGDIKTSDNDENYSAEIDNSGNIEIEKTVSGESSGDKYYVESGEEFFEESGDNKTDIIKRIMDEVVIINSEELLNSISDNLTKEILNDDAVEFIDYFGVNELSGTINIKERFVEIIPTTDFLENMLYYYNESGELLLYESVSNTVGGSSKYYFNNGEIIDILFEYDEEIEEKFEESNEILSRAKLIYDRFISK